jgi:RHS repeat-associated protein
MKNGTTENRTHNAANELQGIATHDANGNMVLMPSLKGKYDAWNRLVEVRDSNNNLIAQYEYNGLNQRIKKTVGSTVTKSFFNENWQEVESQTGTEITSYVWGLRYIDDLVLREKGTERLYSLTDPNWNVVALANASGTVVERLKYDAFGKITWLNATFSIKNSSDYGWNRVFTGQVLDIETGLLLYRNRYYHTGLGRFVSRDPIEYNSSDINIYRYVYNKPNSLLDWSGLKKCGPTVWVYTGSWCVDDDVWNAAIEAAGQTPQAQCAAILPKIILQIGQLVAKYENTGLGLPDVFPLHPNNPHQHCVWNCRMVRRWSVIDPTYADALAIQLSEQKEQIDNQMANIRDNLLTTGCYHHLPSSIKKILNDHANSADQPSDYADNATGRACGRSAYRSCPPANISPIWADTECEDCCTMAGIGPETEEGREESRPWGPRHIPGL